MPEFDPDALEYSPRRSRRAASIDEPLAGLWWQIALGVFVGLMMHSLVTGLYARWELYQVGKQLEKAVRQG